MGGKPPRPFTKGERVGRLTMLGESESRVVGHHRAVYEKCICDCGTVKYILRGHIRYGKVKSCGCYNKEISKPRLIEANTKHGMFGTKFYRTFYGLYDRCNNKKSTSYERYGKRGIKCEWNNFEEFYRDMYESYVTHIEKYGKGQTSIDRIDNNGNYCKENCRRATRKEQQNNRRCNKILFYEGKRYTQQELCDYVGIPKYILMNRLKKGWDLKRALTQPIKKFK